MTPGRLRQVTAFLDRKLVARLLGYASENSLRQCEQGRQVLPEPKASWLEAYAAFREAQAADERAWLERNPPPGHDARTTQDDKP